MFRFNLMTNNAIDLILNIKQHHNFEKSKIITTQ